MINNTEKIELLIGGTDHIDLYIHVDVKQEPLALYF